jgi:hypothetical protein
MKERRCYRRIIKCFMTWLKFRQAAPGQIYPKGWDIVTTHDLGAGGILFNYDQPVEIGTKIELRIVLPEKQIPIRCIGRVIRNEKANSYQYSPIYRVAAEFERINNNSKQAIKNTASKRLCA